MASKKAGRLAGLAALAGLAYMANEKGKGAKDTAAENNRIADARAAREEEKGPASKPSDEAKKPFKDAMFEKEPGPYLTDDKAMYEKEPGFETKTTPAKVASASSPVSKPAQTGRFAPSGSPVLSDNPRKIGNAKAVVAQGGDRSARADMSSPSSGSGSGGRTPRSDAPSSGLGGVRRPGTNVDYENENTYDMSTGKRGGVVKKMASGGMTSSASKRADGIATKGKTRGRMC